MCKSQVWGSCSLRAEFYLGLLVLAQLGPLVRGGVITFTSQSRSVDMNTNGTPFLPMSQQASASDFSPFDKSVNLTFPGLGINQTASQQSTLALTPDSLGAKIDAIGSVFNGVSPGVNGSSNFDVAFNLSMSEPYTLSYNGQQGDPRLVSNEQFVPGFFGGPSAPGELAGDPHTTDPLSVLTYAGILQPGSYDLSAKAVVTYQGYYDASFDVHLAIGTAAVPVPPALWQALIGLPVAIAGAWLLIARSQVRPRKNSPTTRSFF